MSAESEIGSEAASSASGVSGAAAAAWGLADIGEVADLGSEADVLRGGQKFDHEEDSSSMAADLAHSLFAADTLAAALGLAAAESDNGGAFSEAGSLAASPPSSGRASRVVTSEAPALEQHLLPRNGAPYPKPAIEGLESENLPILSQSLLQKQPPARTPEVLEDTMRYESEALPKQLQQAQVGVSHDGPEETGVEETSNCVADDASQHEPHGSGSAPLDVADVTMRRVWTTPENNASDSRETAHDTLRREAVDVVPLAQQQGTCASQAISSRDVSETQDQDAQLDSDSAFLTASATIRCMLNEPKEQDRQISDVAQGVPKIEPCAAETLVNIPQLGDISDSQDVPDSVSTGRVLEDALEQPMQENADMAAQDVAKAVRGRTAEHVVQPDLQDIVTLQRAPERDAVDASQGQEHALDDSHPAQHSAALCGAEDVSRASSKDDAADIILQDRASGSKQLPDAASTCMVGGALKQPAATLSAVPDALENMQSLEPDSVSMSRANQQDPNTSKRQALLQHALNIPRDTLKQSSDAPAKHAQEVPGGCVQESPALVERMSGHDSVHALPKGKVIRVPKLGGLSQPQEIHVSPPGSHTTNAKKKSVHWPSDTPIQLGKPKQSEKVSACLVTKGMMPQEARDRVKNAQKVLADATADQSDGASVPLEAPQVSSRQTSNDQVHRAQQRGASSSETEAKQECTQSVCEGFTPGAASRPHTTVLASEAVTKIMQKESAAASSSVQEGRRMKASDEAGTPADLKTGSASRTAAEACMSEPAGGGRGTFMTQDVYEQAEQQDQQRSAREQYAQQQRFLTFQAERLAHADYEERRAKVLDAQEQCRARRQVLRQDALKIRREKQQRASNEAFLTTCLLARHLCYRGAFKHLQVLEMVEKKAMTETREYLQKTAIAAFRANEEKKLWEACEAEAAAAPDSKSRRLREVAPSRRRAEEQKMRSSKKVSEEERKLAMVSETAGVLQDPSVEPCVLQDPAVEPSAMPSSWQVAEEKKLPALHEDKEEPKFKFGPAQSEQSGCGAGEGFFSESSRWSSSSTRMAGACTACSRALRMFCTLTTGKSHGWQDEDTDDEGEGRDRRDWGAGFGALRPEAPLHSADHQQLPGATEACEVAAQWPRALTAIMASEPCATTRSSPLALGGDAAAAWGEQKQKRRSCDGDGEASPANARRLERLLDSISGIGGGSGSPSCPQADHKPAALAEAAEDAAASRPSSPDAAASRPSSPAKWMLDMAASASSRAEEVAAAARGISLSPGPAKSMLQMAAASARRSEGKTVSAAAAEEPVTPQRQGPPGLLEEQELDSCPTSAGRTSAFPSPRSSRPSSAGLNRSLFSRPGSAASSRVRPTCAVDAVEEVEEAALADAACPSSSSAKRPAFQQAAKHQKQLQEQHKQELQHRLQELEFQERQQRLQEFELQQQNQLRQQDLQLRRLQMQQQGKHQLRKLQLQLEDQLSQMQPRAGLAEALPSSTAIQTSSSSSSSGSGPDLRVLCCREGSSGSPEFLLGWGGSDPDGHHGVSRLELEMLALAQEDVCSALDLESWTMEVFPSDVTGSKVICATAPGDYAKRITGGQKTERRVQRLPAHLGSAEEAVQVCLSGLQPGVALALRLRAWQRRENTWGAPGNVLLLVMPLGGTTISTTGATKCNAELAVMITADMLNGIKAVATPAE